MTTVVWYHVLWQVTFLCTSQGHADSVLRSRRVRSILLKRILATESSEERKTHQWPTATSSWAVIPFVLAGWWRRSDHVISTRMWGWEIGQIAEHFIVKLTLEWPSLVLSILAFMSFSLHSTPGLTKDGQIVSLSRKPNEFPTLLIQHCFMYWIGSCTLCLHYYIVHFNLIFPATCYLRCIVENSLELVLCEVECIMLWKMIYLWLLIKYSILCRFSVRTLEPLGVDL